MLSDNEKKIGAAFSFSGTSAGFCGAWESIEAMDVPSICFLEVVSVADAGFALRLACGVGCFNGVGALGCVFVSGRVVSFPEVTDGNGTSPLDALFDLTAGLEGFSDPADCSEDGGSPEICRAGMIADCGFTTSSGLGAGVTSRIEASPVVCAGVVLRAGLVTAAATCGVEWDTGRVGVSLVSTKSLF